MSRMEWEEYLNDIRSIEKHSKSIGDTWEIIQIVSV